MTVQEKPLASQTVLVTRPRRLADTPLVDRLNSLGANVILHPVIQISEPSDWGLFDDVLQRLSEFGTVVFPDQTAVEYFFGRFREKAGINGLSKCKIAAMGTATADQINQYGEEVDFVSVNSDGVSLARHLIEQTAPEPILILSSSRGCDKIVEAMAQAEKDFEQIQVYQSLDVAEVHPKTQQLLSDGQIDWVTVTSAAIATATAKLFGPELKNTKIASIGPMTSEALAIAGLAATVEASECNLDGLVNAMIGIR